MRIQSMATVHEEFYQTQDFNNRPFKEIVSNVIATIQTVYAEKVSKNVVVVEIKQFKINIIQAIPCTLIIKELASIALKQAYSLLRW